MPDSTADLEAAALEARIVQQAVEHADLMLLARLKYLNREPQSDVLKKQIEGLSQRINARVFPTPAVPPSGAPATDKPAGPTPTS